MTSLSEDLPLAFYVEPSVVDACFERACARPEVQAVGVVPPLPMEPSVPGVARLRSWMITHSHDLGHDHPLWAALVTEGLDARWALAPVPPTVEGLPATVLHECCTWDLFEALEGLTTAMVQQGQSLDVLGGTLAQTPLAEAVYGGGLLTSQALLNAGANPLGDAHGGSLLWAVTDHDRTRAHGPAIIQNLLKAGAGGRINERGPNGQTPLHQAVRGEREPSVKALLKAGADPRVLDADGRSARELAHRFALDAIAQRIDEVWVSLEREALNAVLDEQEGANAPSPSPASAARPRL